MAPAAPELLDTAQKPREALSKQGLHHVLQHLASWAFIHTERNVLLGRRGGKITTRMFDLP